MHGFSTVFVYSFVVTALFIALKAACVCGGVAPARDHIVRLRCVRITKLLVLETLLWFFSFFERRICPSA